MRFCRMLNKVSRSLSEVGRRPSHFGAFSVRPLFVPAMILMQAVRLATAVRHDQPTVINPNCRCQTLRT